ncbi:hypothetical protein DFH06DRAFT_1122882 [Mycena polygramma]|nr:hypothetical protein DFH06DRAFT_1122882 [Mycena polygramma]
MSHLPYMSQPTHAGSGSGFNSSIVAIPSTEHVPTMLPRLKHDNPDDVARPLVALFAPNLASLPGPAIRNELFASSANFIDGLAAVHVPPTIHLNMIPLTFTLPVPPPEKPTGRKKAKVMPPLYPTHVIAIAPPPASERKTPRDAPIPLIAVHGVIIAANCTNVKLPPAPLQPADPRFVSLATHGLTVCSIPAFVILRLYMYGRRIDTFLDALLPFPAPFIKRLRPDKNEPNHASLKITAAFYSLPETRRLADHVLLCTPGGALPMWDRIRFLQDVWQTMNIDLGMRELVLREALELAWQVARLALELTSERQSRELAAVHERRMR